MLRARLLVAAGAVLLLAAEAATVGVAVNLDTVLRQTYERNAEIQTARERVNESQIALNAALQSCLPEMFRKDTFKTPVAQATVWRRRIELRKVETDAVQDAANTYFDWLTTQRGEAVGRDLLKLEEKLLVLVQRLARDEPPVQVVVEATETAVLVERQYIYQTHQLGEAAAAKLSYLMGMNGGALTTADTLQPIDRADTSVSLEVLVRQAQENGPGVREMHGLIASIQQSIAEASHAQRRCCRSGAPLVCGRLQMAQSQLQQAHLSLLDMQLKLRAGVEDAFTAILSGREQIELASKAIDHAKETYRSMEKRLPPEVNPEVAIRNKVFDGVLNSIRQLSEAHSIYLKAVSNYNKAQIRLLLLLGAYPNNCPPPAAL